MERWLRTVRWIQAWGLGLTVFLVAIAKGGMPLWVRAAMVTAIATLFMAEWLPRAAKGRWPSNWEYGWLWVWVSVTGYLFIQIVPLPEVLLKIAGAYPSYYREHTDLPIKSISPVPLKTLSYWAIFSVYWIAAWMVATLKRSQIIVVLAWVAALAVFEAVYGLIAFARKAETILQIWPRYVLFISDVTGTFFNRNHFAGLLVVSWPLGLGLILTRRREGGFSIPIPMRYGMAILYSLFIGIALFNSHSRLGILSAVFGFAMWLFAEVYTKQRFIIKEWKWQLVVSGSIIILAALWVGPGRTIERFLRFSTASSDRLDIWQSTFALPWQTWLFGAGGGAFEEVYVTIQPIADQLTLRYAHNDWLQFFIEFGLLGSALVIISMKYWMRHVQHKTWGLMRTAALGAVAGLAFNSIGDFTLHIPGAALTFWVAVGVLFNQEINKTLTK